MTTAQSLLRAPADDITIDKVEALMKQLGAQETQTVEFKKTMAQSIARSVAAMANSYGGLILVGVDDKTGAIDGVKGATADAVSNHCWEKIDPPLVPEIVSVPLGAGSDKFVLVMRVLPERCPRRPLMVDGAVYVRYNSTTRPASWYESRDLFLEPRDQHADLPWAIQAPQLPSAEKSDVGVDFVLRTGLAAPIAAGTTGRSLSGTTVAALASVLDTSPLAKVLSDFAMGASGRANVQKFQRDGINRARTANLAWWAVPDGWPSEFSQPTAITVEIKAPGTYGFTNTHLQVVIDVTVRSGIPGAAAPDQGFPWQTARFRPQHLADLFDALLSTLTDADVTTALSDFIGADATAVPQPGVLHMICGRQFRDVLDGFGLVPFRNAGSSTGGHVLASPGLDLAEPADRHQQVRSWLTELALDAGLDGMEAVVADLAFPIAQPGSAVASASARRRP